MGQELYLLEGKLDAAARGSKLSKNEGSWISIICTKEGTDINNKVAKEIL